MSLQNSPDQIPLVQDDTLDSIAEKVRAGKRLNAEEGVYLYDTPDLWTLCSLAQEVRTKLHGNKTYYNINRHINYTNICALSTFVKIHAHFYLKKHEFQEKFRALGFFIFLNKQ